MKKKGDIDLWYEGTDSKDDKNYFNFDYFMILIPLPFPSPGTRGVREWYLWT